MPKASTAPKNPEVVHINGRLLYQSCQRNVFGCLALSATVIIITCTCMKLGIVTNLGAILCMFMVPLILVGILLNYLLKICFIDGAMGSLIVRGNKGQPVTL